MKLVWWMSAVCVLSWLIATAVTGRSAGPEIFFGMFGPLLVASASWILADRTYRAAPEQLTAMMITAFAAKLVFFGGYVATVIALLTLEPVPFVASFTAYFIALHVMEAAALHRLFSSPLHPVSIR
jgi:hypothetical protein